MNTTMPRNFQKFILVVLVLLFFGCAASKAQAQSGGNFQLEQSAIAPGGSAVGSQFSSTFVVGQPAAVSGIGGGRFQLSTGFLATAPPMTTAARVFVSGHALTADGTPIVGVRVSLFNSAGVIGSVRTDQNGYFCFNDVLVGRTYILTAAGKVHHFAPQVVSVENDVADLDLISLD